MELSPGIGMHGVWTFALNRIYLFVVRWPRDALWIAG